MKPLSQNDCMAILSALEKVYTITNLEQFPSGVLTAIRHLFNCNTLCYNEIELPNTMTIWITEPSDAMPDPALREAFMRNFTEHPALAYYAQTGDGRSYRISDFISSRKFHDLTLYNEYYRQSSVEYQMVTALRLAPNQMVGLALDRDCFDFSENEKLCLDLLRPHLVQAYRNVCALDIMKQALEENGSKLMIVNRSSQIQVASDDVWQIIAKFFNIPHFCGSIPDMLNNWINFERSRFIQESSVPSPSVPLVISKDCGKLIVRFLWGGKTAEQDLLLFEEEPALALPLSDDSKLTRREAEILAWLSQGKTNAEIALALSISPRTVKKHLEHIYSKLQVHRRSAAVALSYYL
jgi:DNA-binding CsgD family transcriptional regulator